MPEDRKQSFERAQSSLKILCGSRAEFNSAYEEWEVDSVDWFGMNLDIQDATTAVIEYLSNEFPHGPPK